MKVIAESSSTRTEWALVDGTHIILHEFTSGLNPYFLTRREISRSIRLELPDDFFKHRWEHIHFYGSGCANAEKCKTMESSLVAQFKTPCTVESDLLGAARGLLGHNAGIACILSTGSNSAYYDGEKIVKNVNSGGFILGNEGSFSYMCKLLISDILKEIAPQEITDKFYARYNVDLNHLMDDVYSTPMPDRALASYHEFLNENIDHPYIHALIYDAFMNFFRRNIAIYKNHKEYPLHFVGKACTQHKEILKKAADDFGIEIANIERYSLPGLVKYHAGLR